MVILFGRFGHKAIFIRRILIWRFAEAHTYLTHTYRRSGNFRVKNISSDKFSRCFIFVDEPTDEN